MTHTPPLSLQVCRLLQQSDTQELLQCCRQSTSLVLLVPPFDGGAAGPIDDGVRMVPPTAGLTAVFEGVMQQLGVAYEVVQGCSVEERLREVLQLMGRGR